MTLLYTAHRTLEQLTLDRDLMHLRDQLAPVVAEDVYYGFWYAAKLDALFAFIREAQKPVTGEVKLNDESTDKASDCIRASSQYGRCVAAQVRLRQSHGRRWRVLGLCEEKKRYTKEAGCWSK